MGLPGLQGIARELVDCESCSQNVNILSFLKKERRELTHISYLMSFFIAIIH